MTIDRRNVDARVRHPRRSPRARRKKPCSANILAHRTLRSRRATGTSGRHARQQCLPLLWLSQLPRLWISSSFALLSFSQPLHVASCALDEFLNALIAGIRRYRIPFEKEPPLLHHLDPCPCRFRQYLVFETSEMRLCQGHQGRRVVRRSPPHFRLMPCGCGPASVEMDRGIGHRSALAETSELLPAGQDSRAPDTALILRSPGARFRRAGRKRLKCFLCFADQPGLIPVRRPAVL